MFEAVIFDMDGVLVDSEPIHFATTNDVLALRGVQLERADYDPCIGMDEVAFFALLCERFGLDERPRDLAAERVTASLARLASEPLPPRPGLAEFVLSLRMEGLVLAVASSATRAQVDLVLARTGLAGSMATTVSKDEVARGKPAPDLFLEAAGRLEIPPAACLVLEDAVHGIAAARAAGMAAVALPPPGHDGQDHREAGALEVLEGFVGLGADDLERWAILARG